jgi:dihydroneopterin aldolase
MEISSKLIEHLAGRIVKTLLKEFEHLESVYVKVTKINPPIHGQVKSVAVVLEERRKR